ncbi:MAG TPA: hypothetical protein VF998_01465 [Candidatus Limnocylindria bacterium]
MPAWLLRVAAVGITLFALGGSYAYTTAHLKNPGAPLQPPVVAADPTATPSPTPEPATAPPGTARPSQRPTPSPGPRLTLAPGVRSATLPPITFTHVS